MVNKPKYIGYENNSHKNYKVGKSLDTAVCSKYISATWESASQPVKTANTFKRQTMNFFTLSLFSLPKVF